MTKGNKKTWSNYKLSTAGILYIPSHKVDSKTTEEEILCKRNQKRPQVASLSSDKIYVKTKKLLLETKDLFFTVVKRHNIKFTIFTMQFSSVKYIHTPVKHISRTLSPHKTENLYPLNNNSLFPPQPLETTIPLSVSMDLTILDTPYNTGGSGSIFLLWHP